MKETKKQKGKEGSGGNIVKPKIKLVKGTKFVSILFIAVSILISAGIMKAANVYFNLDNSTIMVDEWQTMSKGLTVAGGTINLNNNSAANTTNIGTGTTSGAVAIGGASSTSGTWDAAILSFDSKDNSNYTVTGSGKILTLEAAGGGANQVIINSAGTSGSAIDLNATGTVAGNAVTVDTTNGGISLTAGGADNGDISLLVGDNFSLTGVAGSIFGIATGNVAQQVDIGTGTAIDTINVGTDATTADVIRIGSALADLQLTDAQWNINTSGAATFVGVNSGSGLIQGTDGLTITGTTNINATGTAATNIGNSTGILNLDSGSVSSWTNTAGDLTISTAASGNLVFTSIAAIDMTFALAGGYILEDAGNVHYFEIGTDGTLTLSTDDAATEISLNPHNDGAGIVRVVAGDSLYIGDVLVDGVNDATLVGQMNIFGYDYPAQCSTSCDLGAYIAVSRAVEELKNFPAASTGKVRKYKFIVRYADDLTADGNSTWQIYNLTTAAIADTFTISGTLLPDNAEQLNKGKVYVSGFFYATFPAVTDDWEIRVGVPLLGDILRIYSIDLAAYDVVD